MIYEKIYLRNDGKVPYITTYILDKPTEYASPPRPLVVIFPGGGYGYCSAREAEPIACAFNAAGINAVTVEYRVNTPYPAALEDASDALVYVREHAAEWNTDPDKIVVCGFSAGGHLAASISVLCSKEPAIKREDRLNRPNGMILAYPVISAISFPHQASFVNIGVTTPELMELNSIERQTDTDTPPAFIWHTFSDTTVPLENSLMLAASLRKSKVPFELHVYPDGVHGLSLANDVTAPAPECIVPHAQDWIKQAIEWIKQI